MMHEYVSFKEATLCNGRLKLYQFIYFVQVTEVVYCTVKWFAEPGPKPFSDKIITNKSN